MPRKDATLLFTRVKKLCSNHKLLSSISFTQNYDAWRIHRPTVEMIFNRLFSSNAVNVVRDFILHTPNYREAILGPYETPLWKFGQIVSKEPLPWVRRFCFQPFLSFPNSRLKRLGMQVHELSYASWKQHGEVHGLCSLNDIRGLYTEYDKNVQDNSLELKCVFLQFLKENSRECGNKIKGTKGNKEVARALNFSSFSECYVEFIMRHMPKELNGQTVSYSWCRDNTPHFYIIGNKWTDYCEYCLSLPKVEEQICLGCLRNTVVSQTAHAYQRSVMTLNRH